MADNDNGLPQAMTIESIIFTVEQNLKKDLEFYQTQFTIHKAKGELEEAAKCQMYISQINGAIYENNFKKAVNLKMNMLLSKMEGVIRKTDSIQDINVSGNTPTKEESNEKQNNIVTAMFGGSKESFKVSIDLEIEIPTIALKDISETEHNDFIREELTKIIKDKLKTGKIISKTAQVNSILKK